MFQRCEHKVIFSLFMNRNYLMISNTGYNIPQETDQEQINKTQHQCGEKDQKGKHAPCCLWSDTGQQYLIWMRESGTYKRMKAFPESLHPTCSMWQHTCDQKDITKLVQTALASVFLCTLQRFELVCLVFGLWSIWMICVHKYDCVIIKEFCMLYLASSDGCLVTEQKESSEEISSLLLPFA